jgi:uncharacterized circularly permuted ATP-grasp superfamily protein
LQAIRAGNVLVVNAPGSGFLESSALLGFLPALSEKLFDETLHLPAVPTWWCGERAALQEALAQMDRCVIKPSYGQSPYYPDFNPVLGNALSRKSMDEWAGRILREGDAYTLQTTTPLSQMPTWVSDAEKSGNHAAIHDAACIRHVRRQPLMESLAWWTCTPGDFAWRGSLHAGWR